MIHKYYDYRRPLRWVAAFLIFFLQTHVPFKKGEENNFVPLINAGTINDTLLLNEPNFSIEYNVPVLFYQNYK
jgi:hypothetical protein